MQYESDNQKLYALFYIALIFVGISLIAFIMQSEGAAVFFMFGASIFIILPLFARSRYSIVDKHLVMSNVLKIWTKRIPLKKIRKVYYDDRPMPTTAHFNNPLFLFLRDNRFHRWTYLEVRGKKRKLGKIDAHFLTPQSFRDLHVELKKTTTHNTSYVK